MSETLERVARAIYRQIPTWGMERKPTTAASPAYEMVRVDDTWEEAEDRHEDCYALARVALAALPAELDKTALEAGLAAQQAALAGCEEVMCPSDHFAEGVSAYLTALIQKETP